MKKKTVRFTLTMPEDLVKKLDVVGEEEYLSRNQVICRTLRDEFFEAYKKTKEAK